MLLESLINDLLIGKVRINRGERVLNIVKNKRILSDD